MSRDTPHLVYNFRTTLNVRGTINGTTGGPERRPVEGSDRYKETDATSQIRVRRLPHVKRNYANHDERLSPLFKRPLASRRISHRGGHLSSNCRLQNGKSPLGIPSVHSNWMKLNLISLLRYRCIPMSASHNSVRSNVDFDEGSMIANANAALSTEYQLLRMQISLRILLTMRKDRCVFHGI